jgi:DNA-binding GntR family transcriptional regulator
LAGPRLQDRAYNCIRKSIVEGTLSPGEFVTEGQLVSRLGMSRTPVRSALNRLEQEGLVRILPKQGIYIPEISVAQIHEMYDLRIALETFAARRLAQNPSPDRLKQLRDILAQQKSLLDKCDADQFMVFDSKFHITMVSFLNNRELMSVFHRNEDKLLIFGREILKRDIRRLNLSYEEHVRILAAIESRDPQAAIQLMEEHLIRGRSVLLQNGRSEAL